MDLLVATTNPGKVAEFRAMLAGDRYHARDLRDYPDQAAVEESGQTFLANACIKASAYAKRHRLWTLADDSGLEVDALSGKPGVHSARWASMHQQGSGDADNNRLLISQLASVIDAERLARFVCVLALADLEGNVVLTTRGVMSGSILSDPRGEHGFGYDPLFFVESAGLTTAQMSREQKHQISHRGSALRQLRQLMGLHLP